jgi:hypothetical protein
VAYLLKFGDYVFPTTLMPSDVGGTQHRAAQMRPRASGAISQIARREESTVMIEGALTAATPDDLAALVAGLRAAVYNGKQQFFFGADDRYFRDAQLQNYHETDMQGRTHGLVYDISMQFVAADYPEQFAVAASTPALAAAGVTNVAVDGDTPSLPLWTITIAGAGTGPLTLTNASTSESSILTPGAGGFAAGDVITLDRDTYQVKLNGVANFGLLNCLIPTLDPTKGTGVVSGRGGTNALSLTAAGTATVASFQVSYQARFR